MPAEGGRAKRIVEVLQCHKLIPGVGLPRVVGVCQSNPRSTTGGVAVELRTSFASPGAGELVVVEYDRRETHVRVDQRR